MEGGGCLFLLRVCCVASDVEVALSGIVSLAGLVIGW
jgi:hypothetical protein